MSDLNDDRKPDNQFDPVMPPMDIGANCSLHRLGKVRRRKNISRATIAQRLGVTVDEVTRQECDTTDLPLSVLYKWAQALGVSVDQLLPEGHDHMPSTRLDQNHMAPIMKTAMAIMERAANMRTKRFAQNLVDQLIEIMPALQELSRSDARDSHIPGGNGVKERIHHLSPRVFCDTDDLR